MSHSVAVRCTLSQGKGTTVGPPKRIARLTTSVVESLKPQAARYEIGDPACAGLQLRIADTGVKSWHWRFYWHGKRARLVLGIFPEVGLAQAHELVSAARNLLRKGIDPRRSGLTLAKRVKAESAAPSPGIAHHSLQHLADEFMTRHVCRQRRRPEYVSGF